MPRWVLAVVLGELTLRVRAETAASAHLVESKTTLTTKDGPRRPPGAPKRPKMIPKTSKITPKGSKMTHQRPESSP